MKRLFFGICLTLLLSNHVWARDVYTAKVEVLAKTSSSWDGGNEPAEIIVFYAGVQGTPITIKEIIEK